ncbi:MAG: hypothetical protein AB7G47_20210 [Mycolicibacterium sp.]|uniref:hypothetical protein n=1 Tax=Mycolicibacterium sp. TaxID=2320850 RepID=UPI003D10CC9C
MADIDYALAYDFIRPATPEVKWQLRFTLDNTSGGDPWETNPTGQLVAVIVDYHRADNGHTVALSRPHINFLDAEAVIDRDAWPFLAPYKVNLDEIERRVTVAGLT